MHISHALEVYLLLFVDGLVASLVLPLSKFTAFHIMCCFGGYEATASLIVGALGASFGGLINWFLGRLVYLARMGYHKSSGLSSSTRGYISLMLLSLLCAFGWVHVVGSLINVICGYHRIRIVYTFCAVFLSYLGYMAYGLMRGDCLLWDILK